MKISELQELLERAKEEYGDVQIVVKHPDSRSYYDQYFELEEVWISGKWNPAILVY